MELKYNFKRRRDCRIFAMQQIFASIILKKEVNDVIAHLFEETDYKLEGTFALELIKRTLTKKYDIVNEIKPHINKKWEFDRLDVIDQAILLLSGYELIYTDTPKNVVINEALEITKQFSGLNSVKYINFILDKLSQ